jgi:predicted transcriptional regulator
MATTVHLPGDLLQSVDEHAHALGVSRNRYIVLALKKAISEETTWSHEFLKMLDTAARDKDAHREIDNMIEAISRGRTIKSAPKL